MDTAPAPTVSPTGNPPNERLQALLAEREERLTKSWDALSKDYVHETYEIEAIRNLENRLEEIARGAALGLPEDPHEYKTYVDSLHAKLQELRSTQVDHVGAPNMKAEVVIIKPNVTMKQRLERIEQKVIAEQGRRAMLEDAELIRETVRETARTSVLWSGMVATEEEISQETKKVLVDHLMRLEGKTREQIENISPLDPELELTEEERQDFLPDESLPPAEMAERSLMMEQRHDAALTAKREKIVAGRLAEADTRRELLMGASESQLIELIVHAELFQLAVLRSREDVVDYWLLYCVKNAKKPIMGRARNDEFVKGYDSFFGNIEEVRDVKDGVRDFYDWLIAQRNRLDVLSEEELYALSAYTPFRQLILSMLGPRGGADPVAALFGTPPR